LNNKKTNKAGNVKIKKIRKTFRKPGELLLMTNREDVKVWLLGSKI